MKKKVNLKKEVKKIVIKNMVANGGNLRKAVREAGYSAAYAHSNKITKTKGWKEAVEEAIDINDVLREHKRALKAKRQSNIKGLLIDSEFPDHDVRLKAVDMAYKLKGLYAPEKVQTVTPYDDMTIDELDEEIDKIERQINQNKPKKKK